MTYKDARELAEKSACAIDGKLKSTHWCNTATGTWEIDTMIEKAGCMPTCLINVVNKETEINWKCTGVKDPNQVTTTSTTDERKVLGTLPPQDPSLINKLYYVPEDPKGAFLIDLIDSGFSSGIDGYKFKIDNLTYWDNEYNVLSAVIDVMRPDGTIVQARLGFDECHNTYYDAQVDDIVLRLRSVMTVPSIRASAYAWNYKNISVIKKEIPPEKPDPNATLLVDVNTDGFTSKYEGYKFKVDHIEYSDMLNTPIVTIDVQKSDGTIKQLALKKGSVSGIDNLRVASLFCGTVYEGARYQTTALWVWESAG